MCWKFRALYSSTSGRSYLPDIAMLQSPPSAAIIALTEEPHVPQHIMLADFTHADEYDVRQDEEMTR